MMSTIRFVKTVFAVVLMLCCTVRPAHASEYALNDTAAANLPEVLAVKESMEITKPDDYSFRPKQLILPVSLVAVGTIGVYWSTFRKLDNSVKDGMDNLRGDHFFRADDYIQYLPAAGYLLMGSLGVKAKHSFRERVVVEATSYLVMTGLVNAGKFAFREKRPDSNAHNSFPSGHTATVFTGAELIREEYGTGLGIAAYTVATGVAFLRLYNGRHWLNDVIGGAGFGILSARVGYWMLPLYRKWFGWNKRSTDPALTVVPCYDSYSRSVSVGMAMVF